MKKKKRSYFVDKEFRNFIIHNKCVMHQSDPENCKVYDAIDEYGDGVVTPAHITQRGMGGRNHGTKYEYNNLIPLCSYHHRDFDCGGWSKDEREGMRRIAIILTEFYLAKEDL